MLELDVLTGKMDDPTFIEPNPFRQREFYLELTINYMFY